MIHLKGFEGKSTFGGIFSRDKDTGSHISLPAFYAGADNPETIQHFSSLNPNVFHVELYITECKVLCVVLVPGWG